MGNLQYLLSLFPTTFLKSCYFTTDSHCLCCHLVCFQVDLWSQARVSGPPFLQIPVWLLRIHLKGHKPQLPALVAERYPAGVVILSETLLSSTNNISGVGAPQRAHLTGDDFFFQVLKAIKVICLCLLTIGNALVKKLISTF